MGKTEPETAENKKHRWKFDKFMTYLLAAITAVITLSVLTLYAVDLFFHKGPPIIASDPEFAAIFIAMISVCAAGLAYYDGRVKSRERDVQEKEISRELDRKQDEIFKDDSPEDKLSLENIWQLNSIQLEKYHNIAVSQAKSSYQSTQVATILGFVLMAGSIVLAFLAKDPIVAITSGAVGLIGGGFASYIGSTFMKSQASASEQLSRFFYHPVEVSQKLSAERLLRDLNEVDRSNATKLIIKAMLEGRLNETTSRGNNEK